MVENAGNVPLAFSGLEATQATGTPCNATSLAPMTNRVCSFKWTVSQEDAEAGVATISVAADARDASSTAVAATTYTGSAALTVPQQPALSVTTEHVSVGPHSSNGRYQQFVLCSSSNCILTVLIATAVVEPVTPRVTGDNRAVAVTQ